jgi:hypothetical protein
MVFDSPAPPISLVEPRTRAHPMVPKCSVSEMMSRLQGMGYNLTTYNDNVLSHWEDASHAWPGTHVLPGLSGRLFAASAR